MGWFSSRSDDDEGTARAEARGQAWAAALARDTVPDFVQNRLADARAGRTPWLATMTPVELLAARRHGVRPLAMVSGTCWYHYGFSWTKGHAEGWHAALSRMKQEAMAAGANAIVDVKLRTIHVTIGASMDFTVLGTAVKIDGLPPSRDPVIATVPTMEFVRLLEAGIVPTGIAVGAHYEWLTVRGTAAKLEGKWAGNTRLPELSQFWESVRQRALRDLARDTAAQGNGVLAHTHFGQLLKREGGENQPPQYLGRHIVLGTVVDVGRSRGLPHAITTVVDMRDERSPLSNRAPSGHSAYAGNDEEGAI